MNNMKLDFNSTYISSNLIDELDYVIGGYGKPNTVFIYSLNTFLEAFILNNSFYMSSQELMHIQVISKSIFPSGRPILELLSKTKLNAIGGIGNEIGQVISISKFDTNNPTGYQERVQDFINNGLETTEARERYLTLPTVENEISKLTYLSIGRVEDGFVATISYNSPHEFYKKLNSVTKESNIQATLPFYSYKYQIEDIQTRGISRDIITNLSNTFQIKHDKVNQYFGLTNQTLPPLVIILLSQCKDISDIPTKMLQLREDFTNLRESISKYEARINDAETIKQQLEAIDELNEFWNVFNRKYSQNQRLLYQFWEVAEDSNYEDAIDNVLDSKDFSTFVEDLNVGKVIGKGAKKALDWYKEKTIINRFRGITDIYNLFEQSPNIKKHLSEFERVFDVKINLEELKILNQKIRELKIQQMNGINT